MIYLLASLLVLLLVIFPAVIVYSFRLGASVYHAGLCQGPPLPALTNAVKDEKKGGKEQPEEKWDTT